MSRIKPIFVVLIAVVLTVLIAALMYFMLISKRQADIDNAAKEVEQQKQLVNVERANYQKLVETKNKLPEHEARLAMVQGMIPEKPELPSLMRTIQAAYDPGTGAGLPWLSFTPSEVGGGATAGTAAGTGYYSISFSLTCAGWYDDLVDFVYRVERFSRVVIIDSVNITPTASILTIPYSPNLGLVQAQITARTFTFEAPTGAGAPQPSSTPGSTPSSATTSPSEEE